VVAAVTARNPVPVPVPARPQLALVTALPEPRHGLRWWWLAIRSAADDVWFRAGCAAAPRIAPDWMRRRAWVAGFELALGAGPRGWLANRLLQLLPEHETGNETGWEWRHGRRDIRPGRCRLLPIPGAAGTGDRNASPLEGNHA
jgi:hypothetical protein